jgi:hypothetical protein
MEQPVTLTLEDSARAPASAVVRVRRLSAATRAGRALRALAVLWLAALAAVPLPGLHFFLVPGFLVAGLVSAVVRARATVALDDASLSCPKCAAAVPVEPDTTGWPARLLCPPCGARLRLTPAGEPSAT